MYKAGVTIIPDVQVGEVKSFCVDGPFIGACPGTPSPTETCTFDVSQRICVEIPLTFSASAEAEPKGIVCGNPTTGPCRTITGCTHTIGFYRNHPDVTNALITNAGGFIILGINASGLSFIVTTANANDVLSFNTPSPPAPNSPPFAGQYQVLYAQLLAANLNVLSGATCAFAIAAIDAANSFLATSPPGGMAGAPIVEMPLDEFNMGAASGCPGHCPD
ncbi:hypothetical protein LPY66_07530 [Dehalobacter sp. DCM]|uniref:hypothetical protein n=1 Tax=Dehalobacter sp. DCM TaxID=2907827 RepID=UPI003081E1D8|nr:hypothetical protein LPY66_07530 [Dehalobacter sp. DCM]